MEDLLDLQERNFAWTCFKEWLLSPIFQNRAPLEVAMGETSLFKEIERRKETHWQWWRGDDRGNQLRHLLKRVPEIWEEEGWASTETIYRGRRRKSEYASSVISAAQAIYHDGHQFELNESTYRWAQSVLGETVRQNTIYLVTISTSVYREYLESIGPQAVEGKTRDELVIELGFPKPLINDFVRWILSTGDWEDKQRRVKGERRRELRRIEQ